MAVLVADAVIIYFIWFCSKVMCRICTIKNEAVPWNVVDQNGVSSGSSTLLENLFINIPNIFIYAKAQKWMFDLSHVKYSVFSLFCKRR